MTRMPAVLRFLDDRVQGRRGVGVDEEQVHLARDQVPDLGDLRVHVRARVLDDELARPALVPVACRTASARLSSISTRQLCSERPVAQADHEPLRCSGLFAVPACEGCSPRTRGRTGSTSPPLIHISSCHFQIPPLGNVKWSTTTLSGKKECRFLHLLSIPRQLVVEIQQNLTNITRTTPDLKSTCPIVVKLYFKFRNFYNISSGQFIVEGSELW